MNYESLGKNIRAYRVSAKLTQEKLAEIVQYSSRQIGKVENAESIPSLELVVRIANALNVGLDQLVYGDLANRSNAYYEEFVVLTEGLTSKDNKMSFEMMKAILSIIQEHSTK